MTATGGNITAPCHFQEQDQLFGVFATHVRQFRCHTAFFCSVKCQKTYWPFHKAFCRKNDFADATEGTEPKFARWMRSHGKQAVLKDDEVDRLERKVVNMEDMYGRANPKPEPPKFDAEDMKNMREAEETRLLKARESSKNELYWQEIEVEKCLGLETETIKWKQNQTYVEIFVRLDGYAGGMSAHESAKSEDVQVDMSRSRLSVRYKDDVIIDDKKLYKDIKVELSTWVIVDNVLEICLLKLLKTKLFSDEYLNALRVEDSKVHLDSTSSLTEDDVKKSIPERYYETEFDENYGVRVGNKARHSSNRPMVAQNKNRR
ncbi:unnamed protein product [Bathycoccus prasinos]